MSDQTDNPFYDAAKRASFVQYLSEGMSAIDAAARIGGTPYLELCYLMATKDREFRDAAERAKAQGAALRGVARGEA